MKILVTGATGFLASHLIPLLERLGHDVIPIGRTLDRLAGGLDSVDAVLHLAAITQISRGIENPVETLEANVRGTWQVLEACRLHQVKRVIVASTDKAYGRSVAPYDESTPMTPDGPYETSKACADMLARMYGSTYGIKIAVTRCVNLYGPGHLNFSTLIPGTIKRILHRQRPIVRNGGRMKRDFLFVGDAADAYARLVTSDYVGPMCFGTNRPRSILDVVTEIQQLMGNKSKPIFEGNPLGEIVNQWSSYAKAECVLGWTPTTPWKDGLRRTVEYYREYFRRGKQHEAIA